MSNGKGPSLSMKVKERLDNLDQQGFATFHSAVRLFFNFIEETPALHELCTTLEAQFPSISSRLDLFLNNRNEVLPQNSEKEAAAFGLIFLRRIAKRDSPSRQIYDDLYSRVQDYPVDASQDERDEKMVAYTKRLFLSPFSLFFSDEIRMLDNEDEIDPNTSVSFDEVLKIRDKKTFSVEISRVIEEIELTKTPLSLVIIDLDKFKSVNDNYGHQVGDEVLKEVATLLNKYANHHGKAYRYGGEEFAMILSNHTVSEAECLLERFRSELAGLEISSKNIKVTASIGIAEMPLHAINEKDLIYLADKAMYSAKNLGRNLVRIHGESERIEKPIEKIVEKKLPSPEDLTVQQQKKN